MAEPTHALIFDLDDTLLDTWTLLVPQAVRESCAAMIQAGLKATLEDAVASRQLLAREYPRADVLELLVQKFGCKGEASAVKSAGHQAFFAREVLEDLVPISGVPQMLQTLGGKYALYMVTSGSRPTQLAKLQRLGISQYFTKIFIVEPARGEKKSNAFAEILRQHAWPASGFLSIGNRVDTDIAEAKSVGMRTCWVRQGEYAHMLPGTPNEEPDFVIEKILDLVEKCRL